MTPESKYFAKYGKSFQEKIFQSLLDEQYALLSAKSGSLGLGEMIYQQLKTNLEKK